MLYITQEFGWRRLANHSNLVVSRVSQVEATNYIDLAKRLDNFCSLIYSNNISLILSAHLGTNVNRYLKSYAGIVYKTGDEIIVSVFGCDPDEMMAGISYKNYPISYFIVKVL